MLGLMMKKNIFITGAAGFIGFHLACRLKLRGDHVLGYDNLNDYYSPELKFSRLNQLKKLGVEVIKGDICDLKKLAESIADHKTSHIAHLAAQAGVRYSLINPQAFIKSNIEGFLNILEICRETTTIKLVYASSSSVYGITSKVPFSETDSCETPANLYGATKKANELIAYSYHHLYGIQAIGLRFFTVYGPWGRPDMAYFKFTKSIMEDQPIEIFNYGNMKRDFTYIDDIIDGCIAAIDLKSSYDIFNLGNHQPENLTAMIELLEKYLGKKAKKLLLPMQAGDVISTYADITHSQKVLGFNPKTSLEIGLKNFVEWYVKR
jgi:UDP-glucuronate 4-epimerase